MWGEHLYGSIQTYRTFVLLAAVVGAVGMTLAAPRAGLPRPRVLLFCIGLALSAIAGAKLWGLVEENAFERVALANLFGGFRYPGALCGVVVGVVVFGKLLLPQTSLAAVADLVAPWLGFCEVIGRTGCFLAGCCFGKVCDLPWAVRFPPGSPAFRYQGIHGMLSGDPAASLPVHPLQIYFALVALGLGVFLWRFQRRKAYDGQLILLFVAGHEWAKFLLEFLRFPAAPIGGWSLQAASLVVATLATATLLLLQRTPAARPLRPRQA
jgi:phosphatidylglycerol:prolipoprotein diacylglycerol transferase